jgi:hypothetical protein
MRVAIALGTLLLTVGCSSGSDKAAEPSPTAAGAPLRLAAGADACPLIAAQEALTLLGPSSIDSDVTVQTIGGYWCNFLTSPGRSPVLAVKELAAGDPVLAHITPTDLTPTQVVGLEKVTWSAGSQTAVVVRADRTILVTNYLGDSPGAASPSTATAQVLKAVVQAAQKRPAPHSG